MKAQRIVKPQKEKVKMRYKQSDLTLTYMDYPSSIGPGSEPTTRPNGSIMRSSAVQKQSALSRMARVR